LKNLQYKKTIIYQSQQKQKPNLGQFKDCDFYCGKTKVDNCFNHIVGLPEKDGQPLPLFDYEKDLFNAWKEHRHLWILKATGLGVTEFFLRLMLWLAVRNDEYKGAQFCLVVGPNIDLAKKLIKRMRNIMRDVFIRSPETDTQTAIEVNGVWIQAFPSNHLDAYRSLDKPKFIFLDEADFFRKGEQEDVRHVSERYIGKSNPYIIMVSTPNAPDGLMHAIEEEEQSIYHRIKLGYELGLNKIYNNEEIEEAKRSPSFEREYNLKYLGKVGNVFSPYMIDKVIQLGEQYKGLPINQFALHACGVDPGFGSSRTAIVLTEHLKEQEKIRVIFAEEFDRPNPEAIANICFDIHKQYQNTWFLVDGSNAGFITTLKIKFGENPKIDYQHASPEGMRVVPINFATEHKAMLSHLHLFVNKEYLCIPKQYDKLLLSMRTAIANEYSLDKDQTSYNDSLDALRLSLRGYKMK
jgi:hypothetical protein